jgi:type VII secretion integral membrane protein EccD
VPAASTGLTRLTISAPQRRVDVALPDGVPLAELLPDVLAHVGDGLADDGERHGGWALRRPDGTELPAGESLGGSGVRDGEVLHLVPARQEWPEPEYDDVVEAIAAGARRYSAGWTGSATRVAGVVAAAIPVAIGVWALTRLGPHWTVATAAALGAAVGLVLAGTVAARAYADALTGAALAAYALPYAFAGGLMVLLPDRPLGAPHLLVGAVALALCALVAAVGVAYLLRIFVAAVTAGLLAAPGAVLAEVTSPTGAAAIVLAGLVTGVAAAPLIAIRLGRLPMPVIGLPAGGDENRPDGSVPPDRARVFAAVARTDEMLTGMLLGVAATAVAASLPLARDGGVAGRLLVAVAAAAFLLRARLFVTVRQRVPLLAAGLAAAAAVAVAAVLTATPPGGGPGAALGLAAAATVIAAAGARYARQAPSPYVARAADVLDALCVTAVIPIACAVLGLYGAVRGLVG